MNSFLVILATFLVILAQARIFSFVILAQARIFSFVIPDLVGDLFVSAVKKMHVNKIYLAHFGREIVL